MHTRSDGPAAPEGPYGRRIWEGPATRWCRATGLVAGWLCAAPLLVLLLAGVARDGVNRPGAGSFTILVGVATVAVAAAVRRHVVAALAALAETR